MKPLDSLPKDASATEMDRRARMFDVVFEQASTGMVLADPRGRIARVNRAFAAMLGYEPHELVGVPFHAITHEDDVETSTTQLRKAFAEGRESYEIEKRYRHRDGSTLWGSLRVCLVRDGDGTHRWNVGIVHNLTRHKTTLAQLSFQVQLLDSVPVSVVATDLDGLVTYWGVGAEKLYGYSESEVLGKPVTFIVAPPEEDEERRRMEHVIKHGSWRGEYIQRRRDGSSFWAETFISQVRDENGSPCGFIGIDRDISERKAAEEERRHLQAQVQYAQKLESLGVLAGGIAHDFNNLLTAIVGHASVALADLPPESPARESLRHVDESCQRAAELTRLMLAYSGRGKFEIRRIDPSRLVEELGPLLERGLAKNTPLRYDLGRFPQRIEGDPGQLRQVIMNLITNASESMAERGGGAIEISTGTLLAGRDTLRQGYLGEELPEGRYAFIEVRDSGGGMDGETLERIFDPFFTTKFTGRGLGLAAVLGIVRGHRGTIQIDSRPGEGSTFRVLLPCDQVSGDEAAEAASPGVVGEPAEGKPATVLVVDDEEAVRVVSATMLERAGYRVLSAGGGCEALERFQRHQDEISVVLLDLTMPDMDGPEVYRRLREMCSDTRVVLSSGYNAAQLEERFADRGFAGFLQKPYRIRDLVSTLQRIMPGQHS